MPNHSTEVALGIYLATAVDTKPVLADLDETLKLVSVTRSKSSRVIHTAIIRDDLSSERHFENWSLTTNQNRQVEIWTLDSNGDRDEPLFWGEIFAREIELTDNGNESLLLHARIHWAHCGARILGQHVVTGDSLAPTFVADVDLEFNPEIDGEVIPNAAPPADINADPYDWIDPEAQRSTGAKLWHEVAVPDRWYLEDVAHVILKRGNSSESHIENIDRGAIITQLDTSQFINNLKIKRGLTVPEMLDAALGKYGRGWNITLEKDVVSEPYPILQPKFAFYVEGEGGTERTVKFQAANNATIDHDNHTVNNLKLRIDYGELHNKIIAQGALIERQITVELYRSWPTADDGNYNDDDPGEPIGRKWVAGEAGDLLTGTERANLVGIRDEIPDVPVTLDPTPLVNWDDRRRAPEDMLTLNGDERRRAELEYSEDDGTTWNPVPQAWGWVLLSNELGIRFSGRPIPYQALADADSFRLRLSCTVRGDQRIESIETDANSPNSLEITKYLDVSDRYYDQERITTGATATQFGTPAQTQDDQTDLDTLATHALNREKGATIRGSITLRGFHPEFEIGDVITNVIGREISLNQLTTTPGRYPQVTRVVFQNEPSQQTVLSIG